MSKIGLSDLRILVQVAEAESFSRAALALGMAQPSISRIIGKLEKSWGGHLFDRTGRGVTLTELGKEATDRANLLLRDAIQVNEDLRAYSRVPSGRVSFSLPPSIVRSVVPKLVNVLRCECPGVQLEIFEGFSEQTENWLSGGKIDLGIYSKYYEGNNPPTGHMLESRLMLSGLTKNWQIGPEIDFSDLTKFDLVLPARTNGLRSIVDTVARRLKVTLNVIADADSIVVQKELTRTCGCLMIKAPHTISEEVAIGEFSSSTIRSPHINRHVVLEVSRRKPLSRAGREVADRLTEILRKLSQAN